MHGLIAIFACLVEISYGVSFFDHSTGVAHARWNGEDAYIVESVVSGDLKIGQRLPHEFWPCDLLESGQRYLVSYNCRKDGCKVSSVKEQFAPELLDFLAHEHRETRKNILARALAWSEGEVPAADFWRWITTTAVGEDDERIAPLVIGLDFASLRTAQLPKGESVDAEVAALRQLLRESPGEEEKIEAALRRIQDTARAKSDATSP